MKKFLFLGLAAMMAFTSCTKDETLATAQNGAIGFDVAADKATRSVYDPSTTTDNITNFAVYGFMNEATGVVFRDELVSGSNANGWTYQNTQYWTPNIYYFAALAPSNDRAWTLTEASGDAAKFGIGTVAFTNNGTQDLLYWAGVSDNTANAVEDAPVSIKFNHLLSKVKFSFVNQFDNANATIVVKDIVITNAETEGTIDLAVENWWDGIKDWTVKTEAPFAFGNAAVASATAEEKIAQLAEIESYNEMLLFPVNNKKFNITFVVDLYMGETLADSYKHTVEVETTLEMGKAYDFKATINASNVTGDENTELKPIEFEVEVIDWVEAGEVEVNYEVIDADNVAGKTLESDAVVSGQTSINGGEFNGAGFTVTPTNPEAESSMYSLFNLKGGNATIKNVTIDGQNAVAEGGFGIRAINVREAGEYTVENVKIYNVTYPIHVATTATVKLHVINSVLEGWTSYNPETTADFTGVSFEVGTYARLRPYGTTVLTNCTFEKDFVIDLGSLAAGKTVKFVNCKYDGQPLTEANLTDAAAGTFVIE